LSEEAFERLCDLDDSKRLSPTQRKSLLPVVLELADTAAVVIVSPSQIDREGLHVSNLDALRRALQAVVTTDSLNLVDGYALTDDAPPHEWLTRGDGTSAAIAAASVVAKETRDGMMRQLDAEYVGYGFAVHKGYLTPGHLDAIQQMGQLSPAHRKSFRSRAIDALDLAA
jgi:ribonuclease HII